MDAIARAIGKREVMAKERLPINEEKLWTAVVEPSNEGSGALPPNPTFKGERPHIPRPELDKLMEAFSTHCDPDRIPGRY